MRKKALEKRLARLQAKKQTLASRAQASQDVNEVRSLNEQIEDVNAEIEETNEELAAIDEEERSAAQSSAQPAETRQGVPAGAQMVNGGVAASFGTGATNAQTRENVEPTATMEYRQAFMRYVQTGEPMPAELRAGNAINTQDAGWAIPITIMREVINTVRKVYGNLYSKVRKLNVQGGVEFPIGALKASFKWISESTVSPRQKLDKVGKVSFMYNTAEIRIAQTFLASILSIDAFEQKITEVIAIAYLEAMDQGIVNGTGEGQMLGIVNDTRVTNYVEMCKILTGKNSKKTVFFEVGVGYDENKGILDPWGNPYQVILDADYDGKIDNSVQAVKEVNGVNNRSGQDLRTKVAVYSYGDQNETDLSKLAKSKKLVISW